MKKKTGHLVSGLHANYKRNAEKRGIYFGLSRDEFLELILQACYICGEPPCNRRVSVQTGAVFLYNGVDRVDNSLGYISGNVMPCCWKCNNVKARMGLTELREHLRKMIKGLKGV